MSKFLSSLCVFVLAGMMVAGEAGVTASAEAKAAAQPTVVLEDNDAMRPTFSFTLEAANRYMGGKGSISNDDWVIQPDLSVSFMGFTAGVWSCIDMTDRVGYNGEPEEWNYYVEWSPELEYVDLTIGYCYEDYPRANEADCQKLEFAVNLKTFLSPGIEVAWDFENDIFEVGFNLSYDKEIGDGLVWYNSAELWWGNTHYNCNDNGNWAHKSHEDTSKNALISAVLTTGLEYSICENVTVGPYLKAGWALDHDIREDWKQDEMQNSVNFCGGFVMNFVF